MILVIDNYDSFVFNLARYCVRLGQEVEVIRNDAIGIEAIRDRRPDAIILSPGPCAPDQAGISLEIVKRLGGEVPILGVCLGHQTIAQACGGRIVRSPEPMHGRTSAIRHGGRGVFAGLPDPLVVCRYHSLVVEPESLPAELEVTATSESGLIMAIEHRSWPMIGFQFHPEAILTECGYELLAAVLRRWNVPLAADVDPAMLMRSETSPDVGEQLAGERQRGRVRVGTSVEECELGMAGDAQHDRVDIPPMPLPLERGHS